jgi:type I restriction enzyme S subunit
MRPYLRVANVFEARIDTTDVNSMPFTDAEFGRYKLEKGDILLNEGQSTELVGRPAMYRGVPENCCFQNTLVRFKAFENTDSNYALQRFLLCLHDGTFQKISKKTTSIAHLGVSRFAELVLAWPPLPEQKKIAQILSTWDRAISATARLLENSQQRKKGLMQQLLTGKKRLPGFNGDWEKVTLGSLFQRVTTRNDGQSKNVVTISGQQGLIRQQEFFKKSVASETLDNYFLLKRGQFAYNKSYSNGYPMGAIKRLNRYEDGVVTTLYICFELTDERATDSDFYEQYFESGQLNKGLMQIAHEGGRAHGLLNVKPSDFFSLKVLKPPRDEQKAIANLLVTADRELQAQKNRLERLRTEKKALMQQLLTGRRRVKLETEAA